MNKKNTQFKKGSIPWNKNKKGISNETRQKMRLAKINAGTIPPSRKGKKDSFETRIKKSMSRKEEKNNQWLGDAVGYSGVHTWVKKWKGKPDTCEKCGKTGLTGHKIQWANVDHKYRRILDDYLRLCAKCHRQYDMTFNNYKKK